MVTCRRAKHSRGVAQLGAWQELGVVSDTRVIDKPTQCVGCLIAIEPGYIATPMLEKDEGYGTDAPPYDELGRIWESASTTLAGGEPPGPELVAAAIADALEEEEPVLRHPVGADAEMVVAARESMNFEQFIASMRELLGLDW